MTGPWSAKRY